MSRFVILHHQFPDQHTRSNHWDLMLEWNGRLLTWSLESLPIPNEEQDVDQLFDHRIDYLEYEGPISGDRGWVDRWDTGPLTWIASPARSADALSEPTSAVRRAASSVNSLVARIDGQKLTGQLELERVLSGEESEVARHEDLDAADRLTHRWRLCISVELATRD